MSSSDEFPLQPTRKYHIFISANGRTTNMKPRRTQAQPQPLPPLQFAFHGSTVQLVSQKILQGAAQQLQQPHRESVKKTWPFALIEMSVCLKFFRDPFWLKETKREPPGKVSPCSETPPDGPRKVFAASFKRPMRGPSRRSVCAQPGAPRREALVRTSGPI